MIILSSTVSQMEKKQKRIFPWEDGNIVVFLNGLGDSQVREESQVFMKPIFKCTEFYKLW